METKVCHVIKLWTSFEKNLLVGCYYNSNMVLKRGHNVPPGHRSKKKSLAWIGLSKDIVHLLLHTAHALTAGFHMNFLSSHLQKK